MQFVSQNSASPQIKSTCPPLCLDKVHTMQNNKKKITHVITIPTNESIYEDEVPITILPYLLDNLQRNPFSVLPTESLTGRLLPGGHDYILQSASRGIYTYINIY